MLCPPLYVVTCIETFTNINNQFKVKSIKFRTHINYEIDVNHVKVNTKSNMQKRNQNLKSIHYEIEIWNQFPEIKERIHKLELSSIATQTSRLKQDRLWWWKWRWIYGWDKEMAMESISLLLGFEEKRGKRELWERENEWWEKKIMIFIKYFAKI